MELVKSLEKTQILMFLTISVWIKFPLLNILTHSLIKAANCLLDSSVESFFNIHSKAVRFANIANNRASR